MIRMFLLTACAAHWCTVRTDLSHRCVGDMYILIGIAIMICLMQTGATPLFMASQEGHLDVVNLLISHGANLDKSCEVCHFDFSTLQSVFHVRCTSHMKLCL